VRRRGACVLVGLVLGMAACGGVVAAAEHALYGAPKYGADRFVQARGHAIHYVEAGAGQPILLIPGAFTTYRAWNRVLAELALHARVLAVDYIGVGDSDKPETGFDYTVEEQADVLAEMVRSLRLSDVTVVGASYGGATALNLAARYPDLVDRVVCIEGGALVTPEVLNYSKLGDLLAWPVLGDIIWGFMQSGLFDGTTARSVMGPAWEGLSREERQDIVAVVSANIRTATRSSWLGIYRAITRRIDFTDALDGLRIPVLYLYGTESKYRAVVDLNVGRFERSNPSIEVVPFPGGIHDLHLQYPDAVAEMVLQFRAMTPAGDGVAALGAAPRAHTGTSGRLFD
jgi:pimeloyl-ACP methyl ester carboxylesterase